MEVRQRGGRFTPSPVTSAILGLSALDRDCATGTAQLDAERSPAELPAVGDTGFVGVYHMYDEEATPDATKPDEWELVGPGPGIGDPGEIGKAVT